MGDCTHNQQQISPGASDQSAPSREAGIASGCDESVRELLGWMVQVAEARDADPRARTVNLKFSAPTLRSWICKAKIVLLTTPPPTP